MLYICIKWIDGIRAPLIKGNPTALSTFANRWNHLNVGIMQQEIWKDIPGYVGMYQVSNYGRFKSLARYNGKYHSKEKFLKMDKMKTGYVQVTFCKNNIAKSYRAHRIVAQVFIPNPLLLPIINHKDGNKSNNKVENLEWCTQGYNINYGDRNQKVAIKLSIPILMIDSKNKVTYYDSIQSASKETGINCSNISSCLLGKRKTAGKCKWKYQNEQYESK